MENQTIFKSLSVLKKAQESVKKQLGDKYIELVTPYVTIIQMVMKGNDINEFDALKKIKNELDIYKKPDAPLFFSAALIEITEGKHFVGFMDKVK